MDRAISVFAAARKALAVAIALAALALSSSLALAATNSFIPGVWQAANSDWFGPGNWTIHIPDSATNAYIDNGGTAQIASGAAVAQVIDLGEGTKEAGSVMISGGTLSASGEFVGISGSGTISQSGGTNTSGSEYVGNYGFGSGTISQSGGTNTTGDLILGQYQNSSGAYFLFGTGALSTRNEYIGKAGTGTFNQSGGSNSANQIFIDSYDQANLGTYNLTGGTINATTLYVGFNSNGSGSGVFNQSGGTFSIAQLLNIFTPTSSLRIGNSSDNAKAIISHGLIALDGASNGSTAGQLTALSYFNQNDQAELDIGLGGPTAGTDYGVLTVGGTTWLFGTLRVTLTNGFNPTDGETFNIINGQLPFGNTFSQVILPDINGHWDLAYTPTGVVLTATVVPEPSTLMLLALGSAAMAAARRRPGAR